MLPPPMIIAEDMALDFLNSRAAPKGTDIEWLKDGAALCAWMQTAGLLTEAQARQAARHGTGLDRVAAEARSLRETLRAWLETGDKTLFKTLNSLLAQDSSHLHVTPPKAPGTAAQISRDAPINQPADLLTPIAHAIANMLALPDQDRLRNWDGPSCTLWFHDTSKSNRRRWCSMAICGNRAKAAAHRARTKGD